VYARHAYRQVEGLPVRDICGICGRGPGGHQLTTFDEWKRLNQTESERQLDRIEAKLDALLARKPPDA
jgi:hypothetical protein